MARTSPVCGFITMNTPRLFPIDRSPHYRAFSASCWIFVSIVSRRESPGLTSVRVASTWVFWPRALRSTLWVPYVPRR